ncbi:putative regulatory protein [Gordonia aichiensis NBRC 108223]|uniref:Putative regulatory protein n=2 Tax=Gordonia aichiensis TaxID=36820 RepID=L7KI51_9ACTN|nr:putative regulatory protein [Gordonia aichiensis NBRC 108223]
MVVHMPTYVFRCSQACDDVEQVHSMTAVPDDITCPRCAQRARRIVTAARLGVGDSDAMRVHDATAATADRPAVVSSVPGSARRSTPVTTNPLHRRLPRP